MKHFEPLKLGKYTFWGSFILGNLFMFGALFGIATNNRDLAVDFAISGFLYLFGAAAINIVVLIVLLIFGIAKKENRKSSFTGIAIMLINIPLSILYAAVGTYLCDIFNI